MKFLIDMPLAPRVAAELRTDGHDAIHLSEQRLTRLGDEEIFAKAMSEGRTIVTADLDFGAIIARTGSKNVSVVVFRLVDLQADRVVSLLRRVLVWQRPLSWTEGRWCWSRSRGSESGACRLVPERLA